METAKRRFGVKPKLLHSGPIITSLQPLGPDNRDQQWTLSNCPFVPEEMPPLLPLFEEVLEISTWPGVGWLRTEDSSHTALTIQYIKAPPVATPQTETNNQTNRKKGKID